MPTYNKLVRDRIPEMIAAAGQTGRTRILEEDEYRKELTRKFQEEAAEYWTAGSAEDALEELADLLEVIRSLAGIHGADWERLEALRAEKAKARGVFERRIFLVDVDETSH